MRTGASSQARRFGLRSVVPCISQPSRTPQRSMCSTEDAESWPPIAPFTIPLGLAVDRTQRLCIADAGAHAVWVIELATRRLLRRVPICGTPVDVAPHCDGVVVLARAAQRLYTITGRRGPVRGPVLVRPCYPHGLEPIKLAAGPIMLWRNGTVTVLSPGRTGRCSARSPAPPTWTSARTASSSSRESRAARSPDSPWTDRIGPRSNPSSRPATTAGPSAVDPCGHVAFTTESGIGWTVGSAARHVGKGTLVTYRMDSRAYRTRWGRMFLDACIPRGTTVLARFTTTDDDHDDKPDFEGPGRLLYRRPTGRERPWEQIDGEDRFDTYESPVDAGRGRYLWIELALSGTARLTPRIRADPRRTAGTRAARCPAEIVVA